MAPAPLPDWGKRIKQRREELGFSQALVAKRSRQSQQVISRLERGELNAQISVVRDVCCLGLGAEPAEVLGWPPLRELVAS